MTGGITGNSNFLTETYNYYSPVTSLSAAPKYENGILYQLINGVYVPVTYTPTVEFKTYSRPDNRGKVKKWGVEYDLDFGKIKALNTSVLVSGAYIKSEDSSPGLVYSYLGTTDPLNSAQKFPYIGIYEGQSSLTLGTGRDRLTSSINLVTNIPSLRMVVSLTTQCVWMERSWSLYDKGNIYTLDSQGNPVYGDYNNKSNLATLYRNPIAYIDQNGVIHDFDIYFTTTDSALKTRLAMMRQSTNYSFTFLKTSYNPYFMSNLRLTKEIGKVASLAFYANNFTNSRPLIKNNARPDAPGARQNTVIYFGAELKLTF